MILGLTLSAFAAIALAVLIGTIVQRLSGQAFGMIAAPVVAAFAPQHLPAILLLIGVVVGIGAISMDLSAVNWREARYGFAGRALGAFCGAALAAILTGAETFGLVVGGIILLAVGLTLSGLRLPITPLTLGSAGLVAGIMGTITAIGAPPMAILYANETALRARAMQNLFYMWGMIWSICALAVAGLIDRSDLALAAILLPVAGTGLWAARPAARILAGRPIRPIALAFASLAALTLIGRSVW